MQAMLAVIIVVFSAPKADKKKQDLPDLKTAISKAHKLLERGSINDRDEARSTIDHAKSFDGTLKAAITVKKVTSEDGFLIVEGIICVKRGDKLRYRTEDERRKIADLNEQMKHATEDKKREIDALYDNPKYCYSEQTGGGNLLQGRVKKRLNADGKSAAASIEREFVEMTRQLKRQIMEAGKAATQAEKGRMEICEQVALRIEFEPKSIPSDVADKLTKQKLLKCTLTVDSFTVGSEPVEIGGLSRIESIEAKGVTIIKKPSAAGST